MQVAAIRAFSIGGIEMKAIHLFLGSLFLGMIIPCPVARSQTVGRLQNGAPVSVEKDPGWHKEPSPGSLRVAETTETQLTHLIADRVRCDANGDIYVHPYTKEDFQAHAVRKSPIQKIRTDGSLAETFKGTDAGAGVEGFDFFVASEGKVYQAVFAPRRVKLGYGHMPSVLEFSSDGSFKSKTDLGEEYFVPYKIGVFRSGEFLVSGTNRNEQLFAAVFDSGGKLIKEVAIPEKVPLEKILRSPLPHGEIALGSDGNMYLMRSFSQATIYAVSPAGDVLRTLRINPPDPQWMAISIASASEKLAIAFQWRDRRSRPDAMLIGVIDLQGNEIGTYQSEDDRFGAFHLGCYVPPAFQFFVSRTPTAGLLYHVEPK